MKNAALVIAGFLLLCDVGHACGHCRRARHCGTPARRAPMAAAYAAPRAMAMRYATAAPLSYAAMPSPSPEVVLTSGAAPAATQAVVPTTMAVAAQPGAEVEPRYQYQVAAGTPAYYYSVDGSGKLIVSQWMDYLFRGGRQAGMPTPPPPIIGRLRQP